MRDIHELVHKMARTMPAAVIANTFGVREGHVKHILKDAPITKSFRLLDGEMCGSVDFEWDEEDQAVLAVRIRLDFDQGAAWLYRFSKGLAGYLFRRLETALLAEFASDDDVQSLVAMSARDTAPDGPSQRERL